MHYEVTPVELHYLLTHYDIPATEADGWQVAFTGHLARPMRLTLEDLRRRRAADRAGHDGVCRQRPGRSDGIIGVRPTTGAIP
jgi:hypothetical protein